MQMLQPDDFPTLGCSYLTDREAYSLVVLVLSACNGL